MYNVDFPCYRQCDELTSEYRCAGNECLNNCMGCEYGQSETCACDNNGCSQCITNTHRKVVDPVSGLHYCEPSPCYYQELNCRVCNNGVCNQCQPGYVIHDGACYLNQTNSQ